LAEGQLVTRANEICSRHTQQIVTAAQSRFPTLEIPAAGALVGFAEQTVVPEAEKLVNQLESLNPAEDQERQYDQYLDEADRALEKMKRAPSMVFSQVNPHDAFREANAEAEDLGLTACVTASEQWSNAPFLKSGAGPSPGTGTTGSPPVAATTGQPPAGPPLARTG